MPEISRDGGHTVPAPHLDRYVIGIARRHVHEAAVGRGTAESHRLQIRMLSWMVTAGYKNPHSSIGDPRATLGIEYSNDEVVAVARGGTPTVHTLTGLLGAVPKNEARRYDSKINDKPPGVPGSAVAEAPGGGASRDDEHRHGAEPQPLPPPGSSPMNLCVRSVHRPLSL
jgi:hypothetical protein